MDIKAAASPLSLLQWTNRPQILIYRTAGLALHCLPLFDLDSVFDFYFISALFWQLQLRLL
jgi:hypothetical protein